MKVVMVNWGGLASKGKGDDEGGKYRNEVRGDEGEGESRQLQSGKGEEGVRGERKVHCQQGVEGRVIEKGGRGGGKSSFPASFGIRGGGGGDGKERFLTVRGRVLVRGFEA